jgi:hypothetical protein
MEALTIKKYRKSDFPILLKWMAQYEWTACDRETIPKNALFVCRDGIPIAFSCFCATDCNVAIQGFTIADPDAKGRGEALDFLLATLLDRAASLGYKYIHYSTDSKAMVERMKKQGLIVTDDATAYLMVGSLGGKQTQFFDD